jgi:hypothetical protein
MRQGLYSLVCCSVIALTTLSSAHAANYGLIMTIGEYSDPRASLPGIDTDAELAAKIAKSMGIPEENLIKVSNSQLNIEGIRGTLDQMDQIIGRGDNLFIYYSGHGGQHTVGTNGACSEGMITFDMKTFDDSAIEKSLTRLSNKAGQVVMMNDSCFSGGQASKSPSMRSLDRVPKNWTISGEPAYQCGNAINMKLTRNLVPVATRLGANFLYIAAATEREVAFATRNGSSATVAWTNCLQNTTDRDTSGALTGRELQTCAQSWINRNRFNQTITLIGNDNLPLVFLERESATPSPLQALETLRQLSSPAIKVGVVSSSDKLRIRKDFLDLTVNSNTAGYLYLFHVGSDQKTFELLFPNSRDTNNLIQAGELRLPRPSWGIQAGGPVGENHLMAIVSETPRDFGSFMQLIGESPFRSAVANNSTTRNLTVVGAGQNTSEPGRFGASVPIKIKEVE